MLGNTDFRLYTHKKDILVELRKILATKIPGIDWNNTIYYHDFPVILT